jgi:hypothetical protein
MSRVSIFVQNVIAIPLTSLNNFKIKITAFSWISKKFYFEAVIFIFIYFDMRIDQFWVMNLSFVLYYIIYDNIFIFLFYSIKPYTQIVIQETTNIKCYKGQTLEIFSYKVYLLKITLELLFITKNNFFFI